MLKDSAAYSGFSINDVEATRTFYSQTLGLTIADVPGMEAFGMLELRLKNGAAILLYHKDNHEPATFTVLNFPVPDIDAAIRELTTKGVTMINYHDADMPQDALGVARGLDVGRGPDIAWFADPSGNNLAVMQLEKA